LCKPNKKGGLGLKDVCRFNITILAKWKWRLESVKSGKWKNILLSKYGTELGHTQNQRKYQSWWWKDLFKVCGEGQKGGLVPKSNFMEKGIILDLGRMLG